MSITTQLVMFKEYDDNQSGFNAAISDGAVYPVEIDEASYSAMYNVQKTLQTTCECLGYTTIALGVLRDNIYISLSVIEDTGLNREIEYQDLDQAFEIGLANLKTKDEHLGLLRSQVDKALSALANDLPECDERGRIDHCITVLENH